MTDSGQRSEVPRTALGPRDLKSDRVTIDRRVFRDEASIEMKVVVKILR